MGRSKDCSDTLQLYTTFAEESFMENFILYAV